MAYEALKNYSDRSMTFRFVSNVDGTDFAEAVLGLDPAETLFVVSSKPFTTLETMTNAHTRSEEHTSELQSHSELVSRLVLEKKHHPGLADNVAQNHVHSRQAGDA